MTRMIMTGRASHEKGLDSNSRMVKTTIIRLTLALPMGPRFTPNLFRSIFSRIQLPE
jgi:hypothetical protein